MSEPDDHQLLAAFARTESEPAFAALVGRYVNLVYSTALRSTSNPHHAEEITQAVFIILARKAGQLSPRVVLSGWLYQTARLTSANLIKAESRRRRREQEVYMQSILNEPTAALWKEFAPLLDDAMGRLGQTDRDAMVLRFFEKKSAAEIGAVLGMNEATARKRVNRALEKLRKFFAKRGVVSSAAAIADNISANSIQTAPVALAKSATAVAMAKGSITAATTMTLAEGTMKTMTWLKIKFVMGVGAAALLVSGMATMAISQPDNSGKITAREIITDAQHAYAALSSYNDSGIISENIGRRTLKTTFNIRLQRPDFYRIEWSQAAGFFTNGGVVWSDGSRNFLLMKIGPQNATPEKFRDRQAALAAATGISGQASALIPGTFFKQNWGNVLNPKSATLHREKGEKVDGVDCYAVSSSTGPTTNQGKTVQKMTVTLWIGKRDFLIRRIQTRMEGVSFKVPRMSDEKIKQMLQQQNEPATPEAIAAERIKIEGGMEKAMAMMNSGEFVFTQTHENIVVNKKFSQSDFQEAP